MKASLNTLYLRLQTKNELETNKMETAVWMAVLSVYGKYGFVCGGGMVCLVPALYACAQGWGAIGTDTIYKADGQDEFCVSDSAGSIVAYQHAVQLFLLFIYAVGEGFGAAGRVYYRDEEGQDEQAVCECPAEWCDKAEAGICEGPAVLWW